MELKASHSNFANRVDNLVITQLQLESGSRVLPLKTILQPPATGDSAGGRWKKFSHKKCPVYWHSCKFLPGGTKDVFLLDFAPFLQIIDDWTKSEKVIFCKYFFSLFSWAKLDGTGGLVAGECVKLCSRVCEHGACWTAE